MYSTNITLRHDLGKRSWYVRTASVSLCLFIGIGTSIGHCAKTSYVVKKKDTLTTIAKEFGTTTAEIVRLNKIKSADQIRVGQKLTLPSPSTSKEITYTVKKGDVLSAIAQAHHVSTHRLAVYNNLSHPDQLAIGDTIRIPLPHHGAKTKNHLDSKLEQELNRIQIKDRRWKYIVIHHSGTRRGSASGMDRYHREERHMENGLAYHFVIGNGRGMPNGKIEIGHRWKKQKNGGHLASELLNAQSIGICLVGDFERDKPSKKQLESLYSLCKYLTRTCNLPATAIRSHAQINTKPTHCPGKRFPMDRFLTDFCM